MSFLSASQAMYTYVMYDAYDVSICKVRKFPVQATELPQQIS